MNDEVQRQTHQRIPSSWGALLKLCVKISVGVRQRVSVCPQMRLLATRVVKRCYDGLYRSERGKTTR